MTNSLEELLTLAEKEFYQLTEADKKLFPAVFEGKEADFSADADALTLNVDRIIWLCTNLKAREFLSYRGLEIVGAKVKGELNLSFVTLEIPLKFINCTFSKAISLQQAKLRSLSLKGSKVLSINADEIQVEGSVFLSDGFQAMGEVRLARSSIGGNLYCSKGKFFNYKDLNYQGNKRILEDCALFANSANIKASVFLDDEFEARGAVLLVGASIGGNLHCSKGKFYSGGEIALCADNANITASVFLDDEFKAKGEVRLRGASIGGELGCSGGKFYNKGRIALSADSANIKASVRLNNGFEARGAVHLAGSAIGGELNCSGGRFFNQKEDAVSIALSIDGANIEGDVYFTEDFTAEGLVSLVSARIDDTLFLQEINNWSIRFGQIYFFRWTIKSNSYSLMKYVSSKMRCSLKNFQQMKLDLRFARVGTLADKANSWPDKDGLYLNGFTYNAISETSPIDSKRRLEWLRLQPTKEFTLQPYEQLAAVLKASGHEAAAIEVLIGKEQDRLEYGSLNIFSYLWNRFLGVTIAHGYRPQYALVFSFGFVIFGTVVFNYGYTNKLISPSSNVGPFDSSESEVSEDYPVFNPLLYSIDVFLPIVDLHQESHWLPNSKPGSDKNFLFLKIPSGQIIRRYFWLHIVLGWILTSLSVAGFTGLVRSQNK
ncbi:hypothetical protein Cylst_0130 [Cylindrospermum stagnale PCC 7417]|uniref:Membrane-associated oxidoreductase n=1 Tax=Cylindrospermum stagnale PCC 7417 TaxID=56107 RepID=K9WSJ5_9NOST|nr:hypothetical protein [Cylindrospermum stagnale]AFZ22507.1 hypothetical protein Cylst_0130 [Cylindrospermum stagnale PCC 7417]